MAERGGRPSQTHVEKPSSSGSTSRIDSVQVDGLVKEKMFYGFISFKNDFYVKLNRKIMSNSCEFMKRNKLSSCSS